MNIKFFKKEKKYKKTNFVFHSNFYWELAVCGVFVLTVFSCFFGYHLFIQINQEPATPPVEISSQPTVSKERIQNVLNYFSTREQASNQIIASPTPVIDPSL